MIASVLASLTWNPGFKGLLIVAIAVTILYGSVALILGTNSGARLGFLLALTGLCGWFVVMGIVWSLYGIGYKGPAPTWKVVDTIQGAPANSQIPVAHQLVLPSDLPNPIEVRDASPELLKEYPVDAKDPSLTDLVQFDEGLRKEINAKVGAWKIMDTSNKYTGETQSVVAEALGPDDEAVFKNGASDYIVLDSFLTGGKKGRTNNSIVGRIAYKFTSTVDLFHEPFYAAVQLQPVIPQEAKPGQAPPLPVADKDAPVYTVILERDRGALREPSLGFTLVSTLVFLLLASMLHRRDKLSVAQRAAVAAGA